MADLTIAETSDDKNGTDFWMHRDFDLPALSIDVKVREPDYSVHLNPLKRADDVALETWSVCYSRIGWTRDPSKRTDFILWYWPDTTRFYLVSFPSLCCVFQRYWEQWRDEFRTATQTSPGWKSQCVFVPRAVLQEKLDHWAAGSIAPPVTTQETAA